jgi:mRNA-degrading endonuclease toxin of MazEF toxin-antitoxin module
MRVLSVQTPRRGEVWLVDLGMVSKVRPGLVLSVPVGPQDAGLRAQRVSARSKLVGEWTK